MTLTGVNQGLDHAPILSHPTDPEAQVLSTDQVSTKSTIIQTIDVQDPHTEITTQGVFQGTEADLEIEIVRSLHHPEIDDS